MNYLRESGLLTPTSKLLAAGLLLFGASACSDDELVKDDPANEKTEQQTSALTVITDPSQMPVTVYNYGNGARTNDDEDIFANIPDIPDYSKVQEYTGPNWESNVPSNDCVILNAKGGFPNAGQDIFVKGKWTITGTYNAGNDGKPANIYVLPGGTLEFSNTGFENAWTTHIINIYNYGTLAFNGGENQCRIGGDIELYSLAPIDQIPNLNIACKFVAAAPVKAKRIDLNNAALVYAKCAMEATEEIIFDNESVFHVGYVKAPVVELEAGAKICLYDGAMIDVCDEKDNLGRFNVRNVQSTQVYAEDGGVGLIRTGEMLLNNVGADNLKGTFTNINIFCDKFIYGENVETTESAMGFNASAHINAAANVEVVKQDDACAPKLVVPEEPTEDPIPDIETVTFIDNEHTHPISATCIQFNGDYSYMSWHEMGSGIHGCIEVLKMTPEGLKLQAFAEDETTDFNHILFDNDRLLTVGHNAGHAIVGEIAIPGGTFAQGTELKYYNLKSNRPEGADAGDGNCIIRNGEYIQVASYAGLHTLNSDLTRYNEGRTGFVPTSGSGKHLAIAGDKVLTFNLTERIQGAESSPAELRWFGNTDYEWTNPTTVASDLTVAPVDGKNTIAFDAEGAMYVCLGHEGFKKFVGNAEVASFKNDAPCNGIAVDDKFVYVANGPAFLIFKKNDLSKPLVRLSHTAPYKQDRKPSCNYVAVKGDLIYIAYGRDGVDVLRFNNRDKF